MKTPRIVLPCLALLSSLAAGCTATPESFWKATIRVDCRALKKCDSDLWDETRYDNVGDCVDETLKEFSEDEFAELCEGYDKKFARKCLRSGRKYKRSCDDSDIDEDACSKVCGPASFPAGLTPEETGRVISEIKFAAGEITEEDLEADVEEEDLDVLLQAEIDAVYDEED